MHVAMLVLNDMTADARVTREARTLVSAGHRVDVVALRAEGLPELDTSESFAVHRVAGFTTASLTKPLIKLRQRREREHALYGAVEALRPDIVHCHDTNTLAIGVAAASTLGVPYVYDAHELYPDSLKQRRFQRSWPVQAYLRAVEARLVPRAAAVITVCPGLADVLYQRYGVRAAVVANCPERMPVARRETLRTRLGVPREQVIVLYQGALLPGRALDELVDAVALLPQVTLVVQGRGDYESVMRMRVTARGIADRVVFMGQVPHDDLYALTCGADIGTIFLDGVTLNHQLAWPNRVFMYFMAGIPVLGTDIPGLRELLAASNESVQQPGEDTVDPDGSSCGIREPAGLLVPPRDASAITAALETLLADAALRARMGAAGRARAEVEYNWQVQSRWLLDVYERLAG